METRAKKQPVVETRSRRPVATVAPFEGRVTRSHSADGMAPGAAAAMKRAVKKPRSQSKQARAPAVTKKKPPPKEEAEPIAGSSKAPAVVKKKPPPKEETESNAGSSEALDVPRTRAKSNREASVESKPLGNRKRKEPTEPQGTEKTEVAPKTRRRAATSKEPEEDPKEDQKTSEKVKKNPPEGKVLRKRKPGESNPPEAEEAVPEVVKKVTRSKKNLPEKEQEEIPKEKEKPEPRKTRQKENKNLPEAEKAVQEEVKTRKRAKAPLEQLNETVKVEEKQPKVPEEETKEEETESDKENENKRNVSKNEKSLTNTSGEKKPIYKILNTVANHVPMQQLIVMNEEAEPDDGVYDFTSSQNSNAGEVIKKKPKKRIAKKSSKTASKKPKLWDSKALKKFQKKSAAEARAAKLASIPAHILERVKEKENAKRQSLHASTPLKPSPRMDMNAEAISPIHSKEIATVEANLDETEVFEDNPPETHPDSPEPEDPKEGNSKENVQPWRPDETIPLPTTSHIRQSERDFLPTYSSEMIMKATPKKPKPSPKVPQASTSSAPEPTSASKSTKSPPEQEKSFDYTLRNYFGFDTDDALEVDEEIVQKHGEEALQKERQRLKALAPPRKSPTKVVRVSPRRAIAKRVQQLRLEEAIPAPRDPPKELSADNLFEPERPELHRSYSRPKKVSKMPDSGDEEEESVVIKKKKKKKNVKLYEGKKEVKEGKPKAVSKEEKKREKELDEFCTSFNEMCGEVEQFNLIVE